MATTNETLANAGANTQSAAAQGTVAAPTYNNAAQGGANTPTPGAPTTSTPDPTVASTVPSSAQPVTSGGEGTANGGTTPVSGGANTAESSTPEGANIYEHVASLSNFANIEGCKFSDGATRKIECIFLDKIGMDAASSIYCVYNKNITALTINQSVTDYGITASMTVSDRNGFIQSLADHQSNFYCAINILEVFAHDGGKTEEGYMVQPYIFEIEDVSSASQDGAKEKMYTFKLVDIISATLKKVSYGNLLIWNPAFMQSNNFIDLYKTIIDFAGEIIALSHNKKFHIDTEISFIDDITDSYNDFIKNVVLKDLPISMNCYDLLNYVYKHACREIEPPGNFKGESVGNVMIPVLLQDEIEDTSCKYRTYFNRDLGKNFIKPVSYSGASSINANLVKRGLFAKCILMPFELAFNSGSCTIYENINPLTNNGQLAACETGFNTMNGVVFSQVSDSVDIPPPNHIVGLGWKNLSLMSDTPSGGSNMLIYFNWIYEFYKAAFLNETGSAIKGIIGKSLQPANDPHFHKLEASGLSEGDKEAFAKINSNTIVLKSTDTVREALYHVGRALKSFIFMNALFAFKIKGSVFRHPGEIIKITNPFNGDGLDSTAASTGGIEGALAGFTLAYITNVSHSFNGTTFQDLIFASKICAVTDAVAPVTNTETNTGDAASPENKTSGSSSN